MKPAITAVAFGLAAASLLAGCGSGGGTTSAPEPLKRADGSGGPIGASVKRCSARLTLTGPVGDAIGSLRVSGVGCKTGAAVMGAWLQRGGCIPAKNQSRSACRPRRYRCLSVRVDRGVAVNCARRGRSISFVLRQ